MENILSNREFQALHESELFTSKKYNLGENTGDSGAEIDLFFEYTAFGHHNFS